MNNLQRVFVVYEEEASSLFWKEHNGETSWRTERILNIKDHVALVCSACVLAFSIQSRVQSVIGARSLSRCAYPTLPVDLDFLLHESWHWPHLHSNGQAHEHCSSSSSASSRSCCETSHDMVYSHLLNAYKDHTLPLRNTVWYTSRRSFELSSLLSPSPCCRVSCLLRSLLLCRRVL